MKAILTLAIMMSSVSAFGMGNTDDRVSRPTLDALKKQGFKCEEVWPEGLYQSQVPANSVFTVGIACTNSDGRKKTGSLSYQIDGYEGAKCRDMSVVSIEIQ